MKKVETVIDHLLSQPAYAVLRQQRCFRLIKKALPATLRRGILFIYVKLQEACAAHDIRNVKAFVSRFAPEPKESLQSVPRYKERSDGSFEIECKNERVKKEFESLKETILCSRD